VFNCQWARRAFSKTAHREPNLPFSFVYGGRHSSEFLGHWKCTITDQAVDPTRPRRILSLRDAQTGLEVKAVVTTYTDTPGVDWTLHFTNTGDTDTPILEQVRALDATLGPSPTGTPVLHRLRGCYPAGAGVFNTTEGWLPVEEALCCGKRIEVATVCGKSPWQDSTFFNLEWASRGVITAIGWSGQWAFAAEHVEERRVRLQAGMKHVRLRLRPGETIRTPRVMQLYWLGDEIDSYNLFRQTMFRHVMPRVHGNVVTPPIAHVSTAFDAADGAELSRATTEASVLSHLEAITGLGFEFLWLDAYYTRDGFPRGQGNYGLPVEEIVVDPVRFPRGIKPAMQNQIITAGLNRYVPFSTSGQMGATPYLFRSGVNGRGIVFCDDVRPADYPRDLLKQAIAEAKRIRKYFFGNFYPLTPVTSSPGDWCVMQYHRPKEADGMVLAFRRHESPSPELACELHGIDAGACYEVGRSRTCRSRDSETVAGGAIGRLTLRIDDRPGSLLVEYRQVAPPGGNGAEPAARPDSR